jgi:hypothetical protein
VANGAGEHIKSFGAAAATSVITCFVLANVWWAIGTSKCPWIGQRVADCVYTTDGAKYSATSLAGTPEVAIMALLVGVLAYFIGEAVQSHR